MAPATVTLADKARDRKCQQASLLVRMAEKCHFKGRRRRVSARCETKKSILSVVSVIINLYISLQTATRLLRVISSNEALSKLVSCPRIGLSGANSKLKAGLKTNASAQAVSMTYTEFLVKATNSAYLLQNKSGKLGRVCAGLSSAGPG